MSKAFGWPDGVHGHVGAAALGELLHAPAHVVVGRGGRGVAPKDSAISRRSATESTAITWPAPQRHGRLHGAQAHRPEPEHRGVAPCSSPASCTAW